MGKMCTRERKRIHTILNGLFRESERKDEKKREGGELSTTFVHFARKYRSLSTSRKTDRIARQLFIVARFVSTVRMRNLSVNRGGNHSR